jgi:hypothetical protein
MRSRRLQRQRQMYSVSDVSSARRGVTLSRLRADVADLTHLPWCEIENALSAALGRSEG